MSDRILVQLSDGTRPLTFGGGGPVLNSKSTPWAGVTLEVHKMGAVEGIGESGPRENECGLLVILDGHLEILRRDGKRDVTDIAEPGGVSYLSGNYRKRLLRVTGSGEVAALQFSREWFRRILLDEAPREFGRQTPFMPDATMLALTSAMRDEVARGAPTGKLYAESLSVALLSYAVERVPPSQLSVRGSLPDEHRRRLRNYILEHLSDDLSLTELAALVGRGPRQFSTLFREAFGTTPHRYLIAARLEEGARLLLLGGIDIAEIALRVGFCSQSHFAEAFRRAYGVTPRRYAADRRTMSTSS